MLDGELLDVLDRGLAPRAVAVYGASGRRLQSQAARIARRLITGGYEGRVVLVNPRSQVVHGVETVAHASDSPLAPELDFAVISVPRESVLEAVDDCAASGIKLAVVTSARFAEADGRGAQLQVDLANRARALGVRLIGPNCMGLVNYTVGLFAADPKSVARSGGVSIVSQSGLLSMRLMDFVTECGQGIDLWMTMGNSADLDPPDVVEYLASRPSTAVVVLYLEGIRDRERLATAIASARTDGTDVVLLKAGRTEMGGRAAASHTGAMASSDVFVDVLAEEVDCIRVDTVREAAQVASIIATIGRPPAPYVVVGGSGGDCVLAADACSVYQVPLAVLHPTTIERVQAIVPEAGNANPLDVSPFTWDGNRQNAVIAAIASDPGVGSVVLLDGWGWDVREMPDGSRQLELGVLLQPERGTVVPIINDSRMTEWQRDALVTSGIAVTSDGETVWRSLGHIATRSSVAPPEADTLLAEASLPSTAVRYLPELEAIAQLRDAGVPMVPSEAVSSQDELRGACRRFGFPVVLKGLIPGVVHKADRQLVYTDVCGDEEALHAWDTLRELVALEGGQVMVQPQLRGVVAEIIIGTRDDPVFGLHVMVGGGGGGVEAMSDVAWARAPVTPQRAFDLLARTRVGKRLYKRQSAMLPVSEVSALVALVSQLAVDWSETVTEIEINPLIISAGDLGAVDAVVTLR